MSEALRPYPWQTAVWESLWGRLRSERLPHALLFTGMAGIGKRHLALTFAQTLLCEQPTADGACGGCRSCTLFSAGSHPDIALVEPAEEGKGIDVQQVRDLGSFQSLTGQYGSRRVVVINPADRLNVNAANALLKTLEEPTEGTILLLVTARPSKLLATVRSRCQQVALTPAAPVQAGEWLQSRIGDVADAGHLLAMSGGAPLAALALAEGDELALRDELFAALEQLAAGSGKPVTLAAAWHTRAEPVLLWVYSWVADMARLKAAPVNGRLANPERRERLQALAEPVDLGALGILLERIQRGLALVQGQVNKQLLVEELMITWARCFAAATR